MTMSPSTRAGGGNRRLWIILGGLAAGLMVFAVLAAVGLVILGTKLVRDLQSSIEQQPEREAHYQRIAMEVLGEHLAAKHAGKQALVLRMSPGGVMGLGLAVGDPLPDLEAAMGEAIEVVAVDDPFTANQNDPAAWEDATSVARANRLIAAHPEAKLLICLGMPPMDWPAQRLQSPDGQPPALVVVGHLDPTDAAVQRAVRENRLAAAVIPLFGLNMFLPGDIPDNRREAFEQRYVLLTAANLPAAAKRFRQAMGGDLE